MGFIILVIVATIILCPIIAVSLKKENSQLENKFNEQSETIRDRNNAIYAKDAEIRKLQKEIESLRSHDQTETFRQKYIAQAIELDKANAELRKLQKEIEPFRNHDQTETFQQKYTSQAIELNKTHDEIRKYKEANEALIIENSSLKSELSIEIANSSRQSNEAKELHKWIDELQNQVSSLKTERNHLHNDCAKLQTEIADITAQRNNLTDRISQLALATFRLSDVSPHVWDQIFGLRFKTDKEELHEIVKRYLSDEATLYRKQLIDKSTTNLTAIPYMVSIMADYETHSLELLARQLEWGDSQERLRKIKSIREIRQDAQAMIEKNLEAKYQLEYLLNLFPNLRDVIETDYNDLPVVDATQVSDYDRARDWLSKEEYQQLNSIERNQLALDRYRESHNKTKWQIGRDYELYVGYRYTLKGYSVDYYGSYMGMEDLGRDLIAKKDDTILIIQCKYWSQVKTIHEKHVNQLYGTMMSYCIEHNLSTEQVKGVLVTNITLSDTAQKMADYLHIEYVENYEKGDYPCIKCNIGHDEYGSTKIYHLPFDQQYDSTKIDAPGEFYAMTVKEAEDAGFRRAFKWFGNA